MNFNYHQLISNKQIIDQLEIQSFETNVYLVKLHIGEHRGMLYKGDNIMRFHSAQQVREAFVELSVLDAVMVHDSPYDEMIGNPPKANVSLSMPFSMQLPY